MRSSHRSGSRDRLRDESDFGAHSMGTCGSPTLIAKLLSAFAGHSRASVVSLDPVVAFGTLLELRSFHEVDEVLVVFVKGVVDFVLGTSHAVVVDASTP